jgi:hypothetical protein
MFVLLWLLYIFPSHVYKYYYITLSYFIIRGNISMTIWRVVRKQVNRIYIFTYIKFLCLHWIVFFLFKFEITHKLIITQWSELVNSRKINVVLTMFTKCLLWFESWINIGLWLVNSYIIIFIQQVLLCNHYNWILIPKRFHDNGKTDIHNSKRSIFYAELICLERWIYGQWTIYQPLDFSSLFWEWKTNLFK